MRLRTRTIAAVTTMMTATILCARAHAQDDAAAPAQAAPPAPPAQEPEVPPAAPVASEGPGEGLLEEAPPSSLSPEVGITRRGRLFHSPSEIRFPFVFNSATARLLPGAVVYTSSGVDTGRGLSSQIEVGLGDVAEFGVTVTDLIRGQDGDTAGAEADGLFPYVLAHFKMGVAEGRLSRWQPAMALGFRKSFERNVDEHTSRVAELYFVTSKDIGSKLTLHAGGSFWDASLSNGMDEVTLHGGDSLRTQLRAFGGIELRPLPDAQIMLEVFYLPQFTYHTEGPETIELNPQLAWGVRYELAPWAVVEAGVRIPEIDDVDLLDAQIFGQFKIVSRKLRDALRLE